MQPPAKRRRQTKHPPFAAMQLEASAPWLAASQCPLALLGLLGAPSLGHRHSGQGPHPRLVSAAMGASAPGEHKCASGEPSGG
eukprot:1148880-Pelagomonas_calceolata.AAC.6